MPNLRLIVTPLRALLALAFLLLVVFQTLSFPGQFAYMAKEHPEDAYLRWPLTVFAVVEILCIQIVIACTWKLLDMVREDRIFTRGAFKWVDGIIYAIAAAWLLFGSFALWVVLRADDPGVPMVLFLMCVGSAVIGLLMLVMRTLLMQATELRSDMDSVI